MSSVHENCSIEHRTEDAIINAEEAARISYGTARCNGALYFSNGNLSQTVCCGTHVRAKVARKGISLHVHYD